MVTLIGALTGIAEKFGYRLVKDEKTEIKQLGDDFLKEQGIKEIELVAYDDYFLKSPPLFKEPKKAPAMKKAERELTVLNSSMKAYYVLEEEGKGYTITDNDHKLEAYRNRQYMLYSAYSHFFGEDFSKLSFLDVAGSSGYYSLHAGNLGFKEALCVEGRVEHEAQFNMIKKMLPKMNVDFKLQNVEDLDNSVKGKFDVVSAQGILYHLYDQAVFVKNLHRLTGKILIIDTYLNGRMDTLVHVMFEDVDNPRDSPFSTLSIAPSLPVLLRLLREAGFEDIYHVPYPGMVKESDGSVKDGNGYCKYTRIMLVAKIG